MPIITPDDGFYQYMLRPTEKHMRTTWAHFVINQRGLMLVNGDFGVYGHGWYHHGRRDIREFLAGLAWSKEWSYILSKISRKSHFDRERTVAELREELLRQRREERTVCYYGRNERRKMTADEYRYEADLLKQLEHGDLDYNMWGSHTMHLVVDLGEAAKYVYEPQARMFVEGFFPLLAETIAEELRVERGGLPSGRKEGCTDACASNARHGIFEHELACAAFCTHGDEERCNFCWRRERPAVAAAA